MSKMGISTLASYSGAQTFHAIGLHPEVIEFAFTGTTFAWSRASTSARSPRKRSCASYAGLCAPMRSSTDEGVYRFRRDGETARVDPRPSCKASTLLSASRAWTRPASGKTTRSMSPPSRKPRRSRCVNVSRLKKNGTAIPIEEVEPIEEIRRRFTTAGMSLGALSPEAHETLAIAMNRIGGKSNSGEGRRGPELASRRWKTATRRTAASSRSHRAGFGVTCRISRQRRPKSKSRWRRAPSPVKADRFRATRSRADDRQAAPQHARRDAHFASATPRHLQHRRLSPSSSTTSSRSIRAPRSASSSSPSAGVGTDRGGCRQGLRRYRADLRGTTAERARRRSPRSRTRAARGSSVSPKRTRSCCSTGCAIASPCAPTAA